jgi:hypothetical protein
MTQKLLLNCFPEDEIIVVNSQGEMYDKTSLGLHFPIASYLKSPAGRIALAKSMVQPIRNNINYVGIAQHI